MKRNHSLILLLLFITAAALLPAASWADGGIDPKPFTQGGDPPQQYILLPNQPLDVTLTFNSSGIAEIEIVNDTGKPLTTFSVSFDVPTGDTFDPSCAPGLNTLFTNCVADFSEPLSSGIATYTFSGASVCSTNSDDIHNGKYVSDGDSDDTCGPEFILGLELVGSDTSSPVNGTVVAPEPSSILLLVFGLGACALCFRPRRSNEVA